MRPFDPPRGRATRPGNGAASVPSSPRPLRGVSAFSTLLSHLDECFDAHPGRCPLFRMEVDVQAEKRYPPPPAFIGQVGNVPGFGFALANAEHQEPVGAGPGEPLDESFDACTPGPVQGRARIPPKVPPDERQRYVSRLVRRTGIVPVSEGQVVPHDRGPRRVQHLHPRTGRSSAPSDTSLPETVPAHSRKASTRSSMYSGAPRASAEAGKTKGNLGRSSFGGKSTSKAFWMVSHVDGKTHASISSHLPDRMAETMPPATEHTEGGTPPEDAGDNSFPQIVTGSIPAAWRISSGT